MLKNVKLRDYQKKILDDLKYVPAIGLFMGTGTGKTLTSLARFEQNPTKNLLVICPQKIITQWWEVLEKHTDLKPLKYKLNMSAKNKNKLFEQYLTYEDITPNCVVVNFDILDKITCLDKHIDNNWTIIIDECFDKDTEILTNSGFKFFSELTLDDKVAQYDKDSNEISFVKPLDIIKNKYKGKLVSLHNKTKSINMTPNHVNLIEYNNNINEVYAKDIKPSKNKKLLLSGVASGYRDMTYLERLYVAINADGCIIYKGKQHYRIRMSLSKKRKIDRLIYLLNNCGIDYKIGKERVFENKNWRNSTQIYFSIPCINVKDFSSFIDLDKLSYKYCLDFIDELSYWDSYKRKDCIEYDTTDKQNCDLVQAIISMSNISAALTVINRKNNKHKTIYRLYIRNNNRQDLRYFNNDYIDYDDYVYCVKVPTQAIVVRRNGFVFISGNCHKIKNMGSSKNPVKTTKRCLELGEHTPYKIILTATPTEKENGGYIDLYSQLRFLGYIDYSESYFKSNFCIIDKIQIPGMPFPISKIVGYKLKNINNELKPILNATCRYYVPKYGDYEPQKIKINIPRASNYSKLLRERCYGDIVFDNVSAMRIGKKSLTGGIVTGTNEFGDRFNYDDNNEKADWLEEFLSNTDEVVSVLYCYNVEKEKILKVCKKLKKKYIVINGEVNDKPAELKKDFDVVIGQYQAFSESLDGLQYKCHLMVFYSMPDSSLMYKQSLGRIDRIGQKEVPIYYHLIMNSTIDETIYTMLINKIEFSEKILNEIKE